MQYMWRYSSRGLLTSGYPTEVQNMFAIEGVDRIDAAIERPSDSSLVFFSGTCLITPRFSTLKYPRFI